MRFTKTLLSRLKLMLAITFMGPAAFAQDAAAKTTTSSTNQLEILMAVIALLLAFVIWGMGQVLVAMGKQALEKGKHSSEKVLSVIMLVGLSLLSLTGNAQDAAAGKVAEVANYGGMDSTSFWILATVIFTELVVITFMMFSIRRIQVELLPKSDKEKMMALREWWSRLDKKVFTKAVAVEKEADVLLDHDYDGIRELDNALPPWWKWGFIFTIGVAFIYLLNFHVLGYGKNPTEEYQEEVAKAAQAKELYESKNVDKIDEANLKMPDAAGLTAAKEIFTSVCWTCHGKQGEGGAGPNLTDDYWIHKGSLSDVYQSIKHGYPDKGMQAWEKNYSPKEINNLAGYIKTLKGTNPPNPKAPQGDLYTEVAATDSAAVKPVAVADSLKKKDTSAVIKK